MAGKFWIQSAIKHHGALRKSLHAKEGQNISSKKLAAAASKGGVMGRRARLAQTLRKLPRRSAEKEAVSRATA